MHPFPTVSCTTLSVTALITRRAICYWVAGILLAMTGCMPSGHELRNTFPAPSPGEAVATLDLTFTKAPVALLLDGFAIADKIPASDGTYSFQLPEGNHQIECIYILKKGSQDHGRKDPTRSVADLEDHIKRTLSFTFNVDAGKKYTLQFERGSINGTKGTTIQSTGWTPEESARFPKFIRVNTLFL